MSVKQEPQRNVSLNVSRIALGIAIILFLLGLFLYISSSSDENQSSTTQQSGEVVQTSAPSPKAKLVEGQVIVKFKPGVTDAQISERISPLNASIKSTIQGINATVLAVPPGKEEATLASLADDPMVQYAEPDYMYYLEAIPTDPSFGNQWALVNTGQTVNNKVGKADADVDAELAWDVTKGAGITVAILDSGIDTAHPEFSGKIVGSKTFTTAGIPDKNGHGTHVAGILAAAANNGQGISGICPECKLLIGKITIDDSAGSVPASAIAPSIVWAADSGAKVINMSIAGPNFSQAVQDAVNNAWGKNVVIVAASGNDGASKKTYPAGYANIVSVANTNSSDARSSSSNYGTWVTIAAPGDSIYSTLPTTSNLRGQTNYGYMGGTSMASPLVAGVAALVWSTSYGTNNAAVVDRLFTTADKINGSGSQWVHGRLNAAAAVGANTTPSKAPSAAPSSPPNTLPPTLIPTFVCGGSTNSICPIPSVTNPVLPGGTAYPTGGTALPSTTVPNTTGTVDPCQTGTTAIAHHGRKHKSKHKKRSKGGVNRFVDFILRFFIELLNMILKLIGGGKIPVPTTPTNPNPTDPCLSPAPSIEPSRGPSTIPSGSPVVTVPPSVTVGPSSTITPSTAITAQPSTPVVTGD